ncbi:MAG: co-chaperone GroES [Candidatus Paceibacterota bacterium]
MKKIQGKNKVSKKAVNIMPLGNRVLIKPFTKEELSKKNSFGIILPESDSKEKSEQGKVLAVGPGSYDDGKLIPVTVKVGDTVAFSKYGYEDINLDGEDLFLIKEDNILAILK